jgi:hypothetical protein
MMIASAPASSVESAGLIVEVIADRPAAAGRRRHHGLDAQCIEHARGRTVDVGLHRRLHTAGQQHDLALMRARRPDARILPRGHLGLQRGRQQRPQRLAQLHRRCEGGAGQTFLQQGARELLHGAALDLLVHDVATNVDQPAVLDARRAGRLAIAAGQAAVQVQLRLGRGRLAFEHALDQVDASAWAVEFVAEQLVGRAGGGAEAAVHALAQDGVGLLALGRVPDEVGKLGLHVRTRRTCGRG